MAPNTVICVFCGSSPGKSPTHRAAARSLAKVFHENNVSLVYGGGTVGIMGEMARTLVSLSGPDSVHGVIPAALLPLEARRREDGANQHTPEETSFSAEVTKRRPVISPDENIWGRTTVVPDMHTRKRLMADLVGHGGPGSGFIALSGGFGTLEELMEITTWNQLGIHAHGIVAYNVEGYWDGILKWVNDAVMAGFIEKGNASILVEAKSAEECVQVLKTYAVSQERFNLKWGDEKAK